MVEREELVDHAIEVLAKLFVGHALDLPADQASSAVA
jgi:hypothetical protein